MKWQNTNGKNLLMVNGSLKMILCDWRISGWNFINMWHVCALFIGTRRWELMCYGDVIEDCQKRVKTFLESLSSTNNLLSIVIYVTIK